MIDDPEIKEIQRRAGIKPKQPEPLRRKIPRVWFSFLEGIKVMSAMIALLLWVGFCCLTGRDLK